MSSVESPQGPRPPEGRGSKVDGRLLMPPSPDPPINLLIRVDLFVLIGDACEADRLLLAEAEDAEHLHAVQEKLLDTVLQLVVEIDQDVSAEDDVEVIEGRIRHQVVLREDHIVT